MTLNCANNSQAGNLGVFYAKIKANHYKTGELIEIKAMVFVIEGDAVLLSRRTLKKLGCIDDNFPEVGKYLDVAKVKKVEYPDPSTPDTTGSEESSSIEPPLRQPVGECDPESDIPCSCPRRTFADPPTCLPMPATKNNRKALENCQNPNLTTTQP